MLRRLFLLLLCASSPAGAQLNVIVTEIVHYADPDIRVSPPVPVGGSVYYGVSGTGDSGTTGIYWNGSLVLASGATISGSETLIPYPLHTDGSAFLFSAPSNVPSGGNTYYNSLNTWPPNRVLDRSTLIPGYPVPADRNRIGSGTIGGGQIAFFIQENQFIDPREPTAIGLAGAGGGNPQAIVSEGDAVPNGGGVFREFHFTTVPYIKEGAVLFTGDGTLKDGIYEWRAGALTTVVDSGMSLPEPPGFLRFGTRDTIKEGTSYAFTTGDESRGTAIYRKDAGVFSLVANNQTPIPGGEGNFFNFVSPSLRGGNLVFLGFRDNRFAPPTQYGIYTDLAGELAPIVDFNTDFGGRVANLIQVSTGIAFDSPNSIVFEANFTDGTEGIYRASFSPAGNDSLPYTAVFTSTKSGSITVPSELGKSYQLLRSVALEGNDIIIETKAGTGAALVFSFDDAGSSSDAGFFRVSEG